MFISRILFYPLLLPFFSFFVCPIKFNLLYYTTRFNMQKPSHILAILFLLTVASLARYNQTYSNLIVKRENIQQSCKTKLFFSHPTYIFRSGDIEPTINQNNDQLPVQKQVPKNDKVDPILNVDGIPNIVEETIKLDEHGKVI